MSSSELSETPKGIPDHVKVLQAVREIPFSIGANLIVDFLQGNKKNKSIRSNNLDELSSFGSLNLMTEDIKYILEKLSINRMLSRVSPDYNKFVKVYAITKDGLKEIKKPTLHESGTRSINGAYEENIKKITDADKKAFAAFGFFLDEFNDWQKKSIISPAEHMLCIAGAGTGKTTTLTKRIEFLVKFRSVSPEKILAITFTRKAKRQLEEKLSSTSGCQRVNIQTFNSFCERTLGRCGHLIYTKNVRMISRNEKFKLVNNALKIMKISAGQMIRSYFSSGQRRNKTDQELFMAIVNDCYYVIDYFKGERKRISESKLMLDSASGDNKDEADKFLDMCILVDALMKKSGFRDFSDQLGDTLKLFEKCPEEIPQYEHVLVDEYQDVNSSQIKLIDLLSPKNIFAVGDPRQAIFGWRGSKIEYILSFHEKYPNAEVVPLVTNYRSGKYIIDAANDAIRLMGLPDISSAGIVADNVDLVSFLNEKEEMENIASRVASLDAKPNDIFVLARTNRQLLDFSRILKGYRIKHVVKSDELLRPKNETESDVILSTIHAIKGLEARHVFILGCTKSNFPCRASDHPVMEMFRMHDYDREEEERRLFYVAMTRAKERLILSYSGKGLTNYVSHKMEKIIKESSLNAPKVRIIRSLQRKIIPDNMNFTPSGNLLADLKDWRLRNADIEGIPAYRILTNRSVNEIVNTKPRSLKELEGINGIGPAKLTRYGKDIIEIVKAAK